MHRLGILGSFVLLLWFGLGQAAAASGYAGDYTGYLTTPRQGRMVQQEFDLRVQDDGQVIMSLRSHANRNLTVGEFKGQMNSNGRFIVSGKTGRLLLRVTAGKAIAGTSQINGARGKVQGRPFIWNYTGPSEIPVTPEIPARESPGGGAGSGDQGFVF